MLRLSDQIDIQYLFDHGIRVVLPFDNLFNVFPFLAGPLEALENQFLKFILVTYHIEGESGGKLINVQASTFGKVQGAGRKPQYLK